MQEFDFPLYAALWYHKNGWVIPDVHFTIFEFLEDESQWDNPTKVRYYYFGVVLVNLPLLTFGLHIN